MVSRLDQRMSKMASEFTNGIKVFLVEIQLRPCAIAGIPHGSPALHQRSSKHAHRPRMNCDIDVCQHWMYIPCQQCVRGTVQEPSEVQMGILNVLVSLQRGNYKVSTPDNSPRKSNVIAIGIGLLRAMNGKDGSVRITARQSRVLSYESRLAGWVQSSFW